MAANSSIVLSSLDFDTLKQNFKEYLKSILEDSNTPYFQKADYIGLSLQDIASKIEHIGTNVKIFTIEESNNIINKIKSK